MLMYINHNNKKFFFQMGILLAGASFDLFLEKINSLQRLADSADADNPLYRCIWASLIMPFDGV